MASGKIELSFRLGMAGLTAASQAVSIVVAVVITVPLFIATLVGSFRARARLRSKMAAESQQGTPLPSHPNARSVSDEVRIMLVLSAILGGIMICLAAVAIVEISRGISVPAWDRWAITSLFWITAIALFVAFLMRRGRNRKGVS